MEEEVAVEVEEGNEGEWRWGARFLWFFFLRQKFSKFKEMVKVGKMMSARGFNVSTKHPRVGIKRQFGRLNHRAAALNQENDRCRLCARVKCVWRGESEVQCHTSPLSRHKVTHFNFLWLSFSRYCVIFHVKLLQRAEIENKERARGELQELEGLERN